MPLNGHQSPNGNTLAGVFSVDVFPLWVFSLVAVFSMRRSDNEAQPQTIAEEAFGAATERSVKKKRRSSAAKRKAFFFLASRPSGVASERVCVFLCLFLCTHKEREYFFQRKMDVRMDSSHPVNLDIQTPATVLPHQDWATISYD